MIISKKGIITTVFLPDLFVENSMNNDMRRDTNTEMNVVHFEMKKTRSWASGVVSSLFNQISYFLSQEYINMYGKSSLLHIVLTFL